MAEIVLLNSSVAFLKRNGQYLLMKRAMGRKIAPGIWSGIGGHADPEELNSPLSTCLREIFEETGITQNHIFKLELRYIIIRRADDVIRQNYVYFGETDVSDVTDTEEGTLHWIPEAELLEREFTKTYDAMLKHYIKVSDENAPVVVGVAENMGGKLHMSWSTVEDFE